MTEVLDLIDLTGSCFSADSWCLVVEYLFEAQERVAAFVDLAHLDTEKKLLCETKKKI